MDIRGLRYFVHVARAGSFSRAATELHIAQPALSRQIKKLEDELGTQLLLRHGRGVTITDAGAVLLTDAEHVIDRLAQTLDVLKKGHQSFAGQVTIGVPPTSGLLIVPRMVAALRERWPHATLAIREGISSFLEEWLVDRRIDVAVLHNPSPLGGIHMTPVLKERMVLACAPHHPAASRRGIRLQDIAQIPLILPSLPHSNRRLIEGAATRHNIRLKLALEVDSIPLIKAMVKSGDGATIQTLAGVAAEAARGELVTRAIERPPLTSTIWIAMPHEAHASWLTLEVARLLKASIAQLVTEKIWVGARLAEAVSQE
ncbi:LysR family transcriptional regulator [Bradyrhizobium sp. 1]|uniref:LysR family transcriptional regulator n=1 Tax=Bradyrhizobium sp. 1 TaxID=241591 RepID=UPI001FF8E8D2|nr:LysR family transcriptional regulator [Bradyrhizobium sp. 1]MCK1395725.1 LysR family transcriptional regulator [Bradyrhizobium sp. 1]